MRLIDADAAADEIMRETENHADDLNMVGIALMVGIAKMLRDENNFPTIEAEPVRQGRWVKCEGAGGMGVFVCSVCNSVAQSSYSSFCCGCGAKMRGDEDASD